LSRRNPSTAKIAANQAGADPFSAFVAFHEVGLRAGQTVDYRLTGTGTANYACNRTDGTLDSAPGSQQLATAQVIARQTFIADASGDVRGVMIVPPPAPGNTSCPPGYAIGAWRSSYANMTVTDQGSQVSWPAPDVANQAQ
jgi:hypothetical protein